MRWGDKPLWALVASFLGWELWASQIKKEHEQYTLSYDLWRLQTKYPGTRLLIGAFLGGLMAHLLIFPPKFRPKDID